MLANSENGVKGDISEKKLFFLSPFFPFLVSQESLRCIFKFTHGGVVLVFGKVCQVPCIETILVHIAALLTDVSLPGEVMVGRLGFSLG